jgi:hypothetical protein
VISLHTVLKELEDETNNPDSILNRTGAGKKKELGILIKNCTGVLQQLNQLLIKYNSLGTSTKRTWDRLRWGKENLQEIRENVLTHTSSLALFLTTLGTGSLGRIEKKLDQLIEDVRAGRKQETVVTLALEADDADEADAHWSALKEELVDDGFSKLEVESHKHWIKAKLAELLEGGVLEEQPAIAENRIENGLTSLAPKPRSSSVSSNQSIASSSNSKPSRYQATVEDDDEEDEEKGRETYKAFRQTKVREAPEDEKFELAPQYREKRGRENRDIAPEDSISQIGVEDPLSQKHVNNRAVKGPMESKWDTSLENATRYIRAAHKKPGHDDNQNLPASVPATPRPSLQTNFRSETEYLRAKEPPETQNRRSKSVHREQYEPTRYRNASPRHPVHHAVPHTNEDGGIINEDRRDSFSDEDDSPRSSSTIRERYPVLRQRRSKSPYESDPEEEYWSRSPPGRSGIYERPRQPGHNNDRNARIEIRVENRRVEFDDDLPSQPPFRGRDDPAENSRRSAPQKVENDIPPKKLEEKAKIVKKPLPLTLEELFHGCSKRMRTTALPGESVLTNEEKLPKFVIKPGVRKGKPYIFPKFWGSNAPVPTDVHFIVEEVSKYKYSQLSPITPRKRVGFMLCLLGN